MYLSEQAKADYLTEMGVDTWYPRVSLANAPQSIVVNQAVETVRIDAAVDLSQGERNAETAIKPIAETQQVQSLAVTDSITSAASAGNAAVAQPKAIQPEQAAAKVSQTITFGLGLYVIGDWLVASSIVGLAGSNQEQAVKLMLAILTTMDSNQLPTRHHHEMSWPFFSNANANQGAEAAKEYVMSSIEHLLEEHKPTKFLIFGGVIPKLNGWKTPEGSEFGLPRLVLPSIHKMLTDPTLKAKAWQLIKNSQFYG